MVISDRLVIWYQYAHVVILRSIINMDVEPGDFVEEELMDGVEPLEPGNNQSSNLVVVCEICGALRSEFSTALLFREHYKKHSNPSEKCPDCTKVCGTKFQVLKHRLQVHQSKPKCTVCNQCY